MAQFTNQAQLSYGGTVLNSNVAVGEIREVLSAAKATTSSGYTVGEDVTYIVSIVNSGTSPYTGVTVTDSMGEYALATGTSVYPLTYVGGSARLYIDGVLQNAPTVAVDNTVTFSGINIPAGGNAVLVYEATPNSYAPLAVASSITNTATISGAGIVTPITVTETLPVTTAASLSITKQISPVPVNENGTLTYTFLIQNYGGTAVSAGENVIIRDTFDPLLSDISAALNGTALTTADYTYDTVSGVFATNAGVITVPAATFSQNATTGEWTVTPGLTTVTVSGTI